MVSPYWSDDIPYEFSFNSFCYKWATHIDLSLTLGVGLIWLRIVLFVCFLYLFGLNVSIFPILAFIPDQFNGSFILAITKM